MFITDSVPDAGQRIKNSCPTFSSLLMAARICSGVDAGGGETVGLVGTAEVTEVAETAGRAEEGRVDAGAEFEEAVKREAVVSAVVSDRLVVDSAADADGTEEIEEINEEEDGREVSIGEAGRQDAAIKRAAVTDKQAASNRGKFFICIASLQNSISFFGGYG